MLKSGTGFVLYLNIMINNFLHIIKNNNMKNKSKLPGILFFVGSLLFLHTLSANAFIDGNFAQAKEKAKLEHKMLLVKFTAKWCLPCKWMDKTVFQDSQVIEFLDDKIVGISVDVDDSEGVALQSEYQVKLLPTMLLFHPEGNLLDRKVSSQNSTDVTKWIADQMSLNHITPIQKVEPENIVVVPTISEEEAFFKQKEESLKMSTQTETKINTTNQVHQTIEQNNTTTKELTSSSESEIKESVNYIFGEYYVQVGAYSQFENAKAEAEKLDETFNQGASISDEILSQGKTIYKISLGSFQTLEEAQLFQDLLKQHKINGLIKKMD